MLLSTVYRYLQGQSGLPSTLPARGSVDMAKDESRKIHLLCKGLEHFREIFYTEPEDKSTVTVAVMQDLLSPGSTSTVKGMITDQEPITPATFRQDQDAPGTTNFFKKMAVSQDPAASADTTQDQELLSSTKTLTDTVADRKPRKYVMTTGEDLFQSLFATEKTPPTSPGSVGSDSTLVDPSSRKVSPADSEIRAKGSPIAVKDFAYPSSDSKHVLDQEAVIEEDTKRQLLKQLKKKTAAEEKGSRKVVKLTARNKTLGAQLKLAISNVQNREAQADLAKTYANAMTLSNVVLRQVVKDLNNELNREKNGAQVQGTQSQGETTWSQQKEEPLQNHFELADEFRTSAYGPRARLENASVERSQGMDDMDGQGSIQEENMSPMGKIVEPKNSGSVAVEVLDREASQAEEALDEVKEHEIEKVETEEEKEDEEQFRSGGSPAEETTSQVDVNVEWIFPSRKPQEATVGKKPGNGLSEPSGEHQVSETYDDDSFPAVKDFISRSDSDGNPAAHEHIMDDIAKHDDIQRMGIGHEGCIDGNNGFSEAAGPATLWGILRSNERENEVEDKADVVEEAAGVPEAAGLATLWGVVRSEQYESEVDDQDGACDDAVDVSQVEVPGPATLWGILKSNRASSGDVFCEEGVGNQTGANSHTVLDESENNVSADLLDEGDAELIPSSHDDYAPDLNDDTNDLYDVDVSDDEEEIMEPSAATNAPTVEEDPAPRPHGSVDGDVVAIQEVDAQEVTVEELVNTIDADSPDAVEPITEDLKFVEVGVHDVGNGTGEVVHLQESVVSVVENMPIGTVEDVNEFVGNATVVRVEKAAQEVNASGAGAVVEQLGHSCEKDIDKLTQNDAVARARARPLLEASEGELGPEEGDALEGSAESRSSQVICEDPRGGYIHELPNVVAGVPTITAAESDGTNSGAVHPQPLTPPGTPLPSPRTFSPPQAENFDFTPRMSKPMGVSKTGKRRLERQRAATKKKDEAAVKRRMEEEAAKTPEALAQRQAEEDVRLGGKQMKLQAATEKAIGLQSAK
ncbi:hypothetical protein HO173_000583 [Letharia columbiana]|uniref:Uncharacterized protein n=1 Tax=Letharia columbiana TaxID=112416 RepID=A0A8H6LAH7_9LECA|nr:uncharacterized protein HO173_000583 [Letharia columbiana]KAF6241871.1 hypothetical protein HO173_000583 [Letharia columbiana]